jgi:hypothetical protein
MLIHEFYLIQSIDVDQRHQQLFHRVHLEHFKYKINIQRQKFKGTNHNYQ